MSSRRIAHRICAFAAVAVGLLAAGTAKADFVSSTSTLPVLDVPFVFSGAGSCFPLAGACAEPSTLTFTSVVASPPAPSGFNTSGQEIVVNATLTGVLTDPSSAPIGSLLLTGTVDMEILGRTFSTETGSWATKLLGLDLEGPALGHTVTLKLDSLSPSTGTATIDPITDTKQFLITSFFDVFADISLDANPPLHATREAQLTLGGSAGSTSVPEPASIALLAGATVAMASARRGRGPQKA